MSGLVEMRIFKYAQLRKYIFGSAQTLISCSIFHDNKIALSAISIFMGYPKTPLNFDDLIGRFVVQLCVGEKWQATTNNGRSSCSTFKFKKKLLQGLMWIATTIGKLLEIRYDITRKFTIWIKAILKLLQMKILETLI